MLLRHNAPEICLCARFRRSSRGGPVAPPAFSENSRQPRPDSFRGGVSSSSRPPWVGPMDWEWGTTTSGKRLCARFPSSVGCARARLRDGESGATALEKRLCARFCRGGSGLFATPVLGEDSRQALPKPLCGRFSFFWCPGFGAADRERGHSVPGIRPCARFRRLDGAGMSAAEFFGGGGFESSDEERYVRVGAEGDDLLAVVAGGDGAFLGEFLSLPDEVVLVFTFDGGEGVAVGLRDAEGVVVEFAGDFGCLAGDLDGAVGAVGFEEGLLSSGEGFGHVRGPMKVVGGQLSIGTPGCRGWPPELRPGPGRRGTTGCAKWAATPRRALWKIFVVARRVAQVAALGYLCAEGRRGWFVGNLLSLARPG